MQSHKIPLIRYIPLCCWMIFFFIGSINYTFGQLITSEGVIESACYESLCEDQNSGVFIPSNVINKTQIDHFETSQAWQNQGYEGGFMNIGGLDAETKEKAVDAINKAGSRYDLTVNIITSSCDVIVEHKGIETPSAKIALAEYESNNSADLVVWVHYDALNNTATFARKFRSDAFGSSEKDEFAKTTIEATIDGAASKSLAALSNPNTFIDPEGASIPNNKPWYFGLRENGFEEEKNFYGILKATAGMGWKTIKLGSIPKDIWKEDGQCVFDLPGGVVGPFDAFAQENLVMGIMQCIDLIGKIKEDEQTRKAAIEAIQHPIKTANGILQYKHKVYTGGEGEEQQYYECSFDGATIIIMILTFGSNIVSVADDALKSFVDGLGREVIGAANNLSSKLLKFPDNIVDAFYDRIKVSLASTDDVLAQQMLTFFHKIGENTYEKIIKNVDLIDVWKNYKGVFSEADFITIFKDRFPNGGDFYVHFNEAFDPISLAPGTPNFAKAKNFLNDILNDVNLSNAFKGNGKLIKAWKVLDDLSTSRAWAKTNVDILEKMVAHPTKHANFKNFYKNINPNGPYPKLPAANGFDYNKYGFVIFKGDDIAPIGNGTRYKAATNRTSTSNDTKNAAKWYKDKNPNHVPPIEFANPSKTRLKIGNETYVMHHMADGHTLVPIKVTAHDKAIGGAAHTGGKSAFDNGLKEVFDIEF